MDVILKRYAFGLFCLSFLGVYIISLNLGAIQLSPYRLLLVFAPLLFFKVSKIRKENLRRSDRYSYFIFFVTWVVYSALLLFRVEDFGSWIRMYSFVVTGLVSTWFIGWYFTTEKDIVNALKFVELFAVLIGCLAIYEIRTGNYLYLKEISLGYYQDRSILVSSVGFRIPITIFSNPNNYALFLLFAITASSALIRVKKTNLGRILSSATTLFMVFLMTATQSRAGFIGLCLFSLVVAFFYVNRGSFILMIFLLICLFLFVPWIVENNNYYRSLMEFDVSSGSDYTRMNLIKNGLFFLQDSYFMGVGLGNIEYHMAANNLYNVGAILNMHNWWMELLVSSGIGIFIFYIVVYSKSLIKLFTHLYFKSSHDRRRDFISISFLAFLIAFFVTSVGASSIMTIEWIWPAMALIMAFINIVAERGRFRKHENINFS